MQFSLEKVDRLLRTCGFDTSSMKAIWKVLYALVVVTAIFAAAGTVGCSISSYLWWESMKSCPKDIIRPSRTFVKRVFFGWFTPILLLVDILAYLMYRSPKHGSTLKLLAFILVSCMYFVSFEIYRTSNCGMGDSNDFSSSSAELFATHCTAFREMYVRWLRISGISVLLIFGLIPFLAVAQKSC